jgi:hypothetical protein
VGSRAVSGLELRLLGPPASSQSLYRLRCPVFPFSVYLTFIRIEVLAVVTEEYGLLDCNAVQFGECPMFRRNILRSSSGSKRCKLPPASAEFLLPLLLDSEDAGDMFLRNVGLYPNHTEFNPEYRTLLLTLRRKEACSLHISRGWVMTS